MSRMRSMAVGVLLALASAGLTGCGGSAQPAPERGSPVHEGHNPADVDFARSVVALHSQEIQLADVARDRAGSQRVKDVAEQIEPRRRAELDRAQQFLREWRAPGPDTATPDAGAGQIPGVATEAQLKELSDLEGPAFDQRFTETLRNHRPGAITVAKAELRHGISPGAKRMAVEMLNTQQREINELR